MRKTALRVSSGSEERSYSIALAERIAASNGYATREHTFGAHGSRQSRARNASSTVEIPFCLPFISDELSSAVRRCVHRAGLQGVVRVVDIPPANLKRQLVRNRAYDRTCSTPHCVVCPFGREGDCMQSGVIYLITCLSCGDTYIGETGRPLCCRVKEHVDGMEKSRAATPSGKHRIVRHNNAEMQIAVRILSYEPEILARKTLEAFWINAKNPKLNRKEECIAITQELAPYQSLCGFEYTGSGHHGTYKRAEE